MYPVYRQKAQNKVKRMEKIKTTIVEPYATQSGFHEVEIEKNAWKCLTCGYVWAMRHEAEQCKHTGVYQKFYGGAFINGQFKGNATLFHALRKEELG